MKVITFKFKTALTEPQIRTCLSEIAVWDSVAKVSLLVPNSKNLSVKRMGFVEVKDDDTAKILDRMQSMKEIEYAELPADRHL